MYDGKSVGVTTRDDPISREHTTDGRVSPNAHFLWYRLRSGTDKPSSFGFNPYARVSAIPSSSKDDQPPQVVAEDVTPHQLDDIELARKFIKTIRRIELTRSNSDKPY